MKIRNIIIDILYSSAWLSAVVFNPLAEYHQWRLRRFVRMAANETKVHENILDVGAGELKYKQYFSHCRYVSNDLCVGDEAWNYNGIDIVSSAYDIPVASESFDAILCIQVLEHLDAPDRLFEEVSRILKPGGRLYLSVPLIAGEHQQPHDYYRYTRFGLTALAERFGLSAILVAPHGGCIIMLETLSWAVFWEMLPFRRQTAVRYIIYLVLYPIKLITGLLALVIDVLDRKRSFTINYDVVYEKRR